MLFGKIATNKLATIHQW